MNNIVKTLDNLYDKYFPFVHSNKNETIIENFEQVISNLSEEDINNLYDTLLQLDDNLINFLNLSECQESVLLNYINLLTLCYHSIKMKLCKEISNA